MRIKAIGLTAAMIGFACTNPANSADGPQQGNTAAQKIVSVNYLVGTWSCAHTVGTFAGKYTTTYSKILGDRWLRQTWSFPAQNAGEGIDAAVTAEALIGYDETRQTWVRFFANSLGQHFEVKMADTPNGWSYKYTSFFRRTRPETSDADAIFTKKSDFEYTVDGPTYPQGATQVTEHHTCHKV